MSYRVLRPVLAALMALAIFAAPAMAYKRGSIEYTNYHLRAAVVKLHGKRAPGANIVPQLIAKPGKLTRRDWHKIHRYFAVLRGMRMPRPAAVLLSAGRPYVPPARSATISAPSGGTLDAIAQCESGGNPATNTGNGFYGKYQFTQSTWASVGGAGNPAAASEAEQDRRAAMLYAQSGSSPWPVCGR